MNNEQAKFCANCGHPTNSKHRFCGNCGFLLSDNKYEQENKRKTNNIVWWVIGLIFFVTISVLFVVLLTNGSIINTKLPVNVSRLYQDVTIEQVSKARYPENFTWGLGGWLRGGDEIWCVTYTWGSSSWSGTKSDITVKRGGDFSRYDIYKNMWDMVGCGHEYRWD